MTDFRFEIFREKEYDWKSGGPADEHGFPPVKKYTNYVVQLPHNCDEWVIADEEDKNKAIEEVEAFIEQAKMALEKLKAL